MRVVHSPFPAYAHRTTIGGMLDVDIAALDRWGGLLRSSCVPSVPAFDLPGATGSALTAWAASMRDSLASLDADLDRFACAVSACARNYEDVR
jgi:hypothetical protein